MLLRNFYNILAMQALGVPAQPTPNVFGDGNLCIKNTSGDFDYGSYFPLASGTSYGTMLCGLSLMAKSPHLYGSTAVSCYVFGSGNTAVSFDDCALAAPITSGYTKTAINVGEPVYDAAAKKYSAAVSVTLANTGSAALTITEWGIVTGYTYTTLMSRDLLAEAVTIPAGGNAVLTLNVEYQMPTA